MHNKVKVILREETQQLVIEVTMDQMQTVSIVQRQGKFYRYDCFKPHQNELHFSRCSAPADLSLELAAVRV